MPHPAGGTPANGTATTWHSTNTAAERLGVVPRTVYRLINQGDLAAYRFGRVIRIRDEDIDAFIAGARIQPGTLDHLEPNLSPAAAASPTVDGS